MLKRPTKRFLALLLLAACQWVGAQERPIAEKWLTFDATAVVSDQGLEATLVYWDSTGGSQPYPAHLRRDAGEIPWRVVHRVCEMLRGAGSGWRLINQLEFDALVHAKVFPTYVFPRNTDFPVGNAPFWTADQNGPVEVGLYRIDWEFDPPPRWYKKRFDWVNPERVQRAQVMCVRGQHARLKPAPLAAVPEKREEPRTDSLRLTKMPDPAEERRASEAKAAQDAAAMNASRLAEEERRTAHENARKQAAELLAESNQRQACAKPENRNLCTCMRYVAPKERPKVCGR